MNKTKKWANLILLVFLLIGCGQPTDKPKVNFYNSTEGFEINGTINNDSIPAGDHLWITN